MEKSPVITAVKKKDEEKTEITRKKKRGFSPLPKKGKKCQFQCGISPATKEEEERFLTRLP